MGDLEAKRLRVRAAGRLQPFPVDPLCQSYFEVAPDIHTGSTDVPDLVQTVNEIILPARQAELSDKRKVLSVVVLDRNHLAIGQSEERFNLSVETADLFKQDTLVQYHFRTAVTLVFTKVALSTGSELRHPPFQEVSLEPGAESLLVGAVPRCPS